MKTPRIVITTLAAAVLAAGACLAQAPTPAKNATPAATTQVKAQTTCPVMGGAVNKSLFVDAEGKRIYVCCGGCIKNVTKEPAKYIKILEDQGVTLEKTPPPADATKAPAAEPTKAPAAAK
jgi:hypothetical protein